MTDFPADYDVVIVGARPAGATLAARLGAAGHRVLLVDRARFPSPPAVPSSPAMYPSVLAVLDELGILEANYRSAFVRSATMRARSAACRRSRGCSATRARSPRSSA